MVLRKSLLMLMRNRPINKITVKDLCADADINRGTFYAHYRDPYDLLQQIEAEIQEEIERTLRKRGGSTQPGTVDVVSELFDFIAQQSDLCRVMFSEYGDTEFLRQILFIAHDQCLQDWQQMMPRVPLERLEMIYRFTANGIIGVLQDWMRGDLQESAETVSRLVMQMTYGGLNSFV
jgi:AcrR family transcriptional regulator